MEHSLSSTRQLGVVQHVSGSWQRPCALDRQAVPGGLHGLHGPPFPVGPRGGVGVAQTGLVAQAQQRVVALGLRQRDRPPVRAGFARACVSAPLPQPSSAAR